MLLFGSKTITVEGITVFADHADPNQFWYLPGPVSLARRKDSRSALTFIKYKPAAVAGGAKGGGFLMFEVNLRLDPQLERKILARLASIAPRRPRLTVVPFDEGRVQCVALNVQGSGGTTAPPAPGTFSAVEKILGAATPSLQGDNTAAFSLTLSQEGATILERAFKQGTAPVGVIYDLKFTGMRPALDVEITADYKRCYNSLSLGLSAQIYYVNVGLEAAFEKMVQDGAIKIKVLNFTGEADLKEKERWALDFFKENLLREWFQPTLSPGEIKGGWPQPEPLDAVMRRGTALRPPTTPAPPRPAPTPNEPPPPTPLPGPEAGTAPSSATLPSTAPSPQDVREMGPEAGTHNPPTPSSVQPAATAGLGFEPAQSPIQRVGGASPSGGASSFSPIAFKLRFVHQEELKTVTLRYTTSEAAQRTYAPQGFFGLLAADLARDNYFVEVDLDDPFFRQFNVNVAAPIDFGTIGLGSAHIAIDYGDPADLLNNKHGEFIFDASNASAKDFAVFMNARRETAYAYSVQYHFNPASGWEGQQFSYALPKQITEDRTLLLNPYEHLGFLEVKIFPNKIDRGLVDTTDVVLSYADGAVTYRKTLIVKADSPDQFWRLRLTNREQRTYRYHFVHHLSDGSTRQTEPRESDAAAIPVDDPFSSAIQISLVPLLDPNTIKFVFVDIKYEDLDNAYVREETVTFNGQSHEVTKLRLALMDGTQRKFRYRLTVVGADNRWRSKPYVETEDTRIFVEGF